MGFPFPSTCVVFQWNRAVHPQCIEQIARIHRSWFHEPNDSVIRRTASSYTPVEGGEPPSASRHPSPKFFPVQPSQEAMGRGPEESPFFSPEKYLLVRGGRRAQFPRHHTLPQLGHLSRCCGQPRVTEIIKHSPFSFPPEKQRSVRPPFAPPQDGCLPPPQPTPRNARRGEWRLRKEWRQFSASSRSFQEDRARLFARDFEPPRPPRLQTERRTTLESPEEERL